MKMLYDCLDFNAIFNGSYVFAMKDNGGQCEGSIPSDLRGGNKELNEFWEKKYFGLNNQKYGIHFTPNGVKSLEEKNRKTNLSHINAWFVDVDIEETKKIDDFWGYERRRDIKGDIRGIIFDELLPELLPSLTVETRNGFHIYWFANSDATLDNFDYLQGCLANVFGKYADGGALGALHSLRVPYFWQYKHGEKHFLEPEEWASTMKLYSERELIEYFGDPTVRNLPAKEVNESLVIKRYNNPSGGSVYDKVDFLDITEIMKYLSGKPYIDGELISFQKTEKGYNILCNGVSTPNFIDVKQNKIFSNNQSKFCTVYHFIKWYGHSEKEIFNILKEITEKVQKKFDKVSLE